MVAITDLIIGDSITYIALVANTIASEPVLLLPLCIIILAGVFGAIRRLFI